MSEETVIEAEARELARVQPPRPMNLDPMTIARAFKESGMFPDLKSEAQAVVKIVAGEEVGFGPMASMQAVQMIQGKPTFSANALAALVKRHPAYNYRTIEHSAQVCRLEFREHGQPCGVSEFTIEDAQRAGIANGQSWKKYPKAMLFARALSQGVRWYAPDVTAGSTAYVPEEIGAEPAEAPEPIAPIPADALYDAAADAGLELVQIHTWLGKHGVDAPDFESPDDAREALEQLDAEGRRRFAAASEAFKAQRLAKAREASQAKAAEAEAA